MNQPPIIHAVFVGQPKTITDERGTWTSSIYRDRVTGPVKLQSEGLLGDKSTQPDHGGPENARCVHLFDHYRFWHGHYGLDLQPGCVGENLTLDRICEDEVCVGDIVRVGSGLVREWTARSVRQSGPARGSFGPLRSETHQDPDRLR